MAKSRVEKRKKKDRGLQIGDKFVSLEAFLDPPAGKAKTKPTGDPSSGNGHDAPGAGRKNGVGGGGSSRDGTDAMTADGKVGGTTDGPEPGAAEFLAGRAALPIWKHRAEIREAMRRDDVLIVVGEPGSGKSTQVPQFLLTESWCKGMVAVTQPRRVAATTLAHRVSREAGTPLSSAGSGSGSASGSGSRTGLVGYSVRFDHCVPRGTRIKFLTEGMLLQELLRDPLLRRYSAVVVDEVHERSLDVDLLLGFLKQIRARGSAARAGRPLRVAVMSATTDVDKIAAFFAPAPASADVDANADALAAASPASLPRVLRIPGRQHPIDIVYAREPFADVHEALVAKILDIHQREPLGDILAFLPGHEEIEAAQRLVEERAAALASDVPAAAVFPLFGQMPIEAQHRAFQPLGRAFARKIVLATNIAETSVTVPGVRYVVDSGLAKVKEFRPRLAMESLLAKPISKSSARQRAGRAGRDGPGACYRLYTEHAFRTRLPDHDAPEMLRVDVLAAVLTMKARGVPDVLAFPLLDPPTADAVRDALVQLWRLGALAAADGSVTAAGRAMALLPVAPPLARVLLAAAHPRYDCLPEVVDVVACVTPGYDLFYPLRAAADHEDPDLERVEQRRAELYRREGDLLTYLTALRRYVAEPSPARRARWCRDRRMNAAVLRQALSIRRQLRGLCAKNGLLGPGTTWDDDGDDGHGHGDDEGDGDGDEALEQQQQQQQRQQPFVPVSPEKAEALLRCFLEGFAARTALLAPDGSFVKREGRQPVAVHPASVLHGQRKKCEAIMFLEYVFTTKNYVKKVSAVQTQWIIDALARATGETTPTLGLPV